MAREITFEELGEMERILLLRAFDYDVDKNGYVLSPNGQKISSSDNPKKFIKIQEASLMPGSLKVIDGTPTAISKYLREMKKDNANRARDN